ncbi:Wg001 [Wigglesworthia glossinidia endosymbiont of Glossina brevipalpis]|uniref:Wg001 protein n=1 Tax=Wigglesworthia glossinidia brevipalpis TaxID=36870 RepID=Q8D1W4_WIGBR|nr:Wg001 [Wigglesworthia glossinidia endosymbiont of Glossina brevipalpis]
MEINMLFNILNKKVKHIKLFSFIFIFVCMILTIPLHLFPCYVSGFISYNMILKIIPIFEKFIINNRIRWIAISLIFIFFIILMTLTIFSLVIIITSDLQYAIDIFTENTDFFSIINNKVPNNFFSFFSDHSKNLKDYIITFIKDNLIVIKNAGKHFLHGLVTIFISFIIGSLIAINKPIKIKRKTDLINHIIVRLKYFSSALSDIFFSQIKISSLNTLLTSLIILVIFPFFGINLPLGKTLIIATFIFGMLPIIGNFISNCMLITSALSISLKISGIMLLYLVFIHKLEYFLNAKIIGNRINAKSWELLLSMLIFESLFGIEGLIAAPIFYAYLKKEIKYYNISF